ncbi:MAG: hypothetical protein KAV87_13635, partial [Desulfobacteraceae bacterium]|nr:hypothetical protein [Desulfobacteraceae bacterium]
RIPASKELSRLMIERDQLEADNAIASWKDEEISWKETEADFLAKVKELEVELNEAQKLYAQVGAERTLLKEERDTLKQENERLVARLTKAGKTITELRELRRKSQAKANEHYKAWSENKLLKGLLVEVEQHCLSLTDTGCESDVASGCGESTCDDCDLAESINKALQPTTKTDKAVTQEQWDAVHEINDNLDEMGKRHDRVCERLGLDQQTDKPEQLLCGNCGKPGEVYDSISVFCGECRPRPPAYPGEGLQLWRDWYKKNCPEWNAVEDIEAELARVRLGNNQSTNRQGKVMSEKKVYTCGECPVNENCGRWHEDDDEACPARLHAVRLTEALKEVNALICGAAYEGGYTIKGIQLVFDEINKALSQQTDKPDLLMSDCLHPRVPRYIGERCVSCNNIIREGSRCGGNLCLRDGEKIDTKPQEDKPCSDKALERAVADADRMRIADMERIARDIETEREDKPCSECGGKGTIEIPDVRTQKAIRAYDTREIPCPQCTKDGE